MTKSWQEVIEQPGYQNLSEQDKRQVRSEYFDEVIKPQIKNPGDTDAIWQEFNDHANKFEPELNPDTKAVNTVQQGERFKGENIMNQAFDTVSREDAAKDPDRNRLCRSFSRCPRTGARGWSCRLYFKTNRR